MIDTCGRITPRGRNNQTQTIQLPGGKGVFPEPEELSEEEEELSVEDLLQSTQQEELENIEAEQKSEARKLIENFVDENPEAVATLLRNWLDEDWG